MGDVHTYRIEVRGQVDESDLNAASPHEVTVVRAGPSATLLTICADQSALVGLIRHLHGRGFVLLSVNCEQQTDMRGGKMSTKAVSKALAGDAPVTGVQPASLPVTCSLALVYAFSLAIALLMAGAAVTGLVFRESIYAGSALVLFLVPTDLVTLAVVLPVLLVSMWLARRGKLVGLLLWPGALLYALYIYIVYTISVPFGVLFLPYLALVTLSAYTTIGLVASIDADAVRDRLAGAVPARAAGAVLAILAALFIGMQVVQVIAALATQAPLGDVDLPPFIADTVVLAPTWLAGGILLWRRRPLGYASGAGLLFVGSTLFGGLGFVVAYPAISGGSPVDVGGVVSMLAMAAVCLVPLVLYLRGIARS